MEPEVVTQTHSPVAHQPSLTLTTTADTNEYVLLRISVQPDADGQSELSELLDALRVAQAAVLEENEVDEEDRAYYERMDLLRHSCTTQAISQLTDARLR